MMDRIREFLHRKPFVPFRIVMASGERHDVVNSERIALGSKQVFLVSGSTGRMTWLKVEDIELVYMPRSVMNRVIPGREAIRPVD